MKHLPIRRLTAALCALLLALTLTPAALAAPESASSRNQLRGNYSGNAYHPIQSYLCENSAGGLTRVELIDKQVVAEDYSSDFALLASRTLPMELPLWGGFFAGADFNFLLFGQTNSAETDSAEVLRIVRYDKSWNRLDSASVYGANTLTPFSFGTARMAEADGVLYIHTCHTMYKLSDGLNHQANMHVTLRQRDMAVTEVLSGIGGYWDYTSHSFNQFIIADSLGNIVTADHGDAYPRCMALRLWKGRAGETTLETERYDLGSVTTDTFLGETGNNYTYATLGGLAETESGYLIAFSQALPSSPKQILPVGEPKQVKIGYIAKSDFDTLRPNAASSPQNDLRVQTITAYTGTGCHAGNPMLVPTGLDGGYVLWNQINGSNESQGFCYAPYRADGSVGTVRTLPDIPLSDCQPILYRGNVVWYAAGRSIDRTAPTFYTLSDSGVTARQAGGSPSTSTPGNTGNTGNIGNTGNTGNTGKPGTGGSALFTDVPATHWAYAAIREAVDSGLAVGNGDGTFQPSGQMTNAHFCTFLARAFYGASASSSTSPWYRLYTDMMEDHDILSGTTLGSSFAASVQRPISRYDMAQMLYNVLRDKGAALPDSDAMAQARSRIADWSQVPPTYRTAVSACYAAGLINGMEDGGFGGGSAMNRAQGCTLLSRAIQYLDRAPQQQETEKPSQPEIPTQTEKPTQPEIPDPETPGNPDTPDQPDASEKPEKPSPQAFAEEVVRLVNIERGKEGLQPLTMTAELQQAAQRKAQDMVDKDYFSHTSPTYGAPGDMLRSFGIRFTSAAENIAAGYSTPEQVVQGWMNSSGHRANILGNYTQIGVGYAAPYWAQLFITPDQSGGSGRPTAPTQPTTPPGDSLAAFRAEVIRLINQDRAARGLGALQESSELNRAAQVRAEETASLRGTTRPDGTRYDTVLTELGITGIGYRGENTFWNCAAPEAMRNVWQTNATMMSSVLYERFTHVGIGYYRGSDGTIYCSQFFGEVK